jgi:ribosomal-protein-alanine N-acetyltransferase
MTTPGTSIRLVESDDAEALAVHFCRDAEVFARWDPEWPPEFYIVHRAWRKAELGYWIASPYQGQGHATRAVSLAVQMMITELDLHRAEAITQMDNLGSQHVLRNNGFVPFGIARSRIFTAGKWRDEILWERLLDQ